jgi:hypothetical protein
MARIELDQVDLTFRLRPQGRITLKEFRIELVSSYKNYFTRMATVTRAVERALALAVADADAVRLLLERAHERPAAGFDLTAGRSSWRCACRRPTWRCTAL